MIPAADIAAARARHDVYGREVALKRQGAWWTGRCPFHDDRAPSFGVKNGWWRCFAGCGQGDAIDFVRRLKQLDFAEAVKELLGAPLAREGAAVPSDSGGDGAPAIRRLPQADAAAVRRLMAQSQPVTRGTAAAQYLELRGLPPEQPALRAHPRLYCAETGGWFPGMLAPLVDERGEVVAVQRFFLADRIAATGSGYVAIDRAWNALGPEAPDSRAPVQARRKTLGAMGRAAVRLGEIPGAVLGIAEGIEKGIAASLLFAVPCWAACGASRMAALWIPREVRHLLIFADSDDAGRRAAEAAAERYPMHTEILYPDRGYRDWDEQYRARRG